MAVGKDIKENYKSYWTQTEFWGALENLNQDKIKFDSISPKLNTLKDQFEFNSFEKLFYDPELKEYAYKDAITNDWLTFDLWFEADRAVEVFLELGSVSLVQGKNESIYSTRIGFVEYDASNTKAVKFNIYNPYPSIGSPFGSGQFFDKTYINQNFRELVYGSAPLLAEDLENPTSTYYVMTEDERVALHGQHTFTTLADTKLFSIPGEKAKITVHIWIEGWDGDSVDAAKGSEMNIKLRFIGKPIGEVTP